MQKGILLIYDEQGIVLSFSAFGDIVEVLQPLQTVEDVSRDSMSTRPGREFHLVPFQGLCLPPDLKQSHLQIPVNYNGVKIKPESLEKQDREAQVSGIKVRISDSISSNLVTVPSALAYEEQTNISETPNRSSYIPERLLRAIRYIETNLSSRISLDKVAQEACLSRFHFSRLFKKYFAVSPMQFILNLRIYRATILLQNTDVSIFNVSIRVGFSNLSEFYRQFKKTHKMTPSEFRSSFLSL